MDSHDINEKLSEYKDFNSAVIFNSEGKILFSKNYNNNEQEIRKYLSAYDSRDGVMASGFIFEDKYYEVHRFHPPLIYGRILEENKSIGISLCRGYDKNKDRVYFLVNYILPNLSAKVVPIQVEFYNKYIGEVDSFIN